MFVVFGHIYFLGSEKIITVDSLIFNPFTWSLAKPFGIYFSSSDQSFFYLFKKRRAFVNVSARALKFIFDLLSVFNFFFFYLNK